MTMLTAPVVALLVTCAGLLFAPTWTSRVFSFRAPSAAWVRCIGLLGVLWVAMGVLTHESVGLVGPPPVLKVLALLRSYVGGGIVGLVLGLQYGTRTSQHRRALARQHTRDYTGSRGEGVAALDCPSEGAGNLIDCKCPYCGGPLSFPSGHCGAVQECPSCCGTFVLPASPGASPFRVPLPIQSARLALRRLLTDDSGELFGTVSDPDSCRFIDWRPLTEAEVTDWLDRERHPRLSGEGGHLCLGIVLMETDQLVGFISIHYLDGDERQAGFTIMINHAFRSCGYGTEAVQAALRFGFESLGLRRIAVDCDSRNEPAQKMLEKAGMRREGEFVEDRELKGQWTNTLWYAILKRELGPREHAAK